MATMFKAVSVQLEQMSRAVFWGGFISGALDLACSVSSVTLRGYSPIVSPQAIASGLLGMSSFKDGLASAALGVELEFLITFVATAVYYLASRRLTFLVRQAVAFGLLYGVAIYFFMHLIVVPLSDAPKFTHTRASIIFDFAVHLVFIGLPMALAVRRFSPLDQLN
jgi:hypothetical protein